MSRRNMEDNSIENVAIHFQSNKVSSDRSCWLSVGGVIYCEEAIIVSPIELQADYASRYCLQNRVQHIQLAINSRVTSLLSLCSFIFNKVNLVNMIEK